MTSAGNALAREFMTDVNRLCSAVARRAEAKEDEEESHLAILGQYLVKGRGFLLLNTLNGIIDQNLTCREELITLLLSLLPIVWKIPVQEEKAKDFTLLYSSDASFTKVLNSSLLHVSSEKTDVEESSCALLQSSLRHRDTRHPRRTVGGYSERFAKNMHQSTTDSENNSDEKNLPMFRHRRLQFLQPFVMCHPKDEKLETAGAPNLKDDSKNFPEFTSESLNNDDTLHVTNVENSPFELCRILLSLLEKVCKCDITLNHNSTFAASVVPTLIEFLSGFGDWCSSDDPTEVKVVSAGWTEEPIALVQRMLCQTVLQLMSVNIISSQTMPDNFRKNLTELLRSTLKIKTYLEKQSNPFAPEQTKLSGNSQQDFTLFRYRHRALLLPELLGGVLQILFCCLQTASSNSFYFSQAIELVHEFIQHQGFQLLTLTVLQLEWIVARGDDSVIQASEHVQALISSIMKVIGKIKKVKAEQLHQSMCARKRHRRCEYSHFMHHHRDLSGLPVSAFQSQISKIPFEELGNGEIYYPERCCCVAVCAHQCLCLLQQVSLISTCEQILSGVNNVGICCCMDPKSVIVPLLTAFKLPILKNIRQPIVELMSKLLLDQLGGGEVSTRINQAPCNICTVDFDQLPKLKDVHGNISELGSASSFCGTSHGFQGILPNSGPGYMLLKWDALQYYEEIVFGEDIQIREQIASHLCHLIVKGNCVVQWKIYVYIFNPMLQRGVELVHCLQQLSTADCCTDGCSCHSKCLPQKVLQIYLQTLPTLLQSRVLRDLFLNYNGVNQMTELNYLESTRCHSLNVFKALIFCLGEHSEQQKDGEQNDYSLNLTQETFSEARKSLRKFYAGLTQDCPKKRKNEIQDVQAYVINIFICVAFLCVSKESDLDQNSANDSEDTSGYDSTASDHLSHMLPCLSFESLTLPSTDQTKRAADIWSMCRWMYLSNPVFQKQFHRLGGFNVCHRLIFMLLHKLAQSKSEQSLKREQMIIIENGNKLCENSCSKPVLNNSSSHLAANAKILMSKGNHLSNQTPAKSEEDPLRFSSDQSMAMGQFLDDRSESVETEKTLSLETECSLQNLRLFESLLAICLHSTTTSQHKMDIEMAPKDINVEHILNEIHELICKSGIVQTTLAKPLFDSLLRVSLANYSDDSNFPAQRKEEVLQAEEEIVPQSQDPSEEADKSQYSGFRPFTEEGYDADNESGPEEFESNVEDLDHKNDGQYPTCLEELNSNCQLIFPEICTLEVNLLSANQPSVDVLEHVFHGLAKITRNHKNNAMLLIEQGVVISMLRGFRNILTQTDSSFKECQLIFIDLLVCFMSLRTCSEELSILLRLFMEKSLVTELLLKGILKIIDTSSNMSPSQYITFPLLHNATAGNVSGQKPAIGSKATGFLKRPKLPQIKKEVDCENYFHRQLSSWHIAPIHLPLVGQNCWPHMSEGFSVSLWLKSECLNEGEKTLRKKTFGTQRKSMFSKSHVDFRGDINKVDLPKCNETLVKDGCLHLISLGSKTLMIQVWADLINRAFIFRLCIDPDDETKACLLAQASSQGNVFLPGSWQHLTFTYLQQSESQKNIYGKISLWISGERKADIDLHYVLPRRSLSSDLQKMFCMIGHCSSNPCEQQQLSGRWNLGNVLLFNGATIGPEEAFYLYVCGADCNSIMHCKYGKPENIYSKYVNKDILHCEQMKELFMKQKELDFGRLRESLAAVYTPCYPSQYTIYEPVIRLKGHVKTIPTQRPFSLKEALSSLPDSLFLKNLQVVQHKDLQSVLHEIGGIGAFVFLFARVEHYIISYTVYIDMKTSSLQYFCPPDLYESQFAKLNDCLPLKNSRHDSALLTLM